MTDDHGTGGTPEDDFEPGYDRDPRRPREVKPMSVLEARLLRVGVGAGVALVVVPILVASVGIGAASGVPEGLRGATHLPEMNEKVSFAFRSTMVLPFLVLPGVLLGVSCALALASEQRRKAAATPRTGPDAHGPV